MRSPISILVFTAPSCLLAGSAIVPFTATVLPLGVVWKGLIGDALIFSGGW